ncbi:MAG TPA: SDR family NAD(P)-dependent oxidoreductase [Micromonosporaceae bacterium]
MPDHLRFDRTVAVVTGAGGGLGRSHALALARRGASVVVNDVGAALDGSGSSASRAEQVVAEIEALGGNAVANHDSVATPEGGEAIIEQALRAFGRVDIVVNNAGNIRDATFANMTAELADPVIDVHLRGAFHVTRPAWLRMREQKFGRIVSTSSGSGIFGNFGQSNYAAAKMGLIGLTSVLAIEGAKYNIKANVVAPIASTRMNEAHLGALNEVLRPELVTAAVVYLAHASCEVTGRAYSCGGGRMARIFFGVAPGLVSSSLTPEEIAARMDLVEAQEGYTVPASVVEEVADGLKALGIDTAG